MTADAETAGGAASGALPSVLVTTLPLGYPHGDDLMTASTVSPWV